MSSRTTDTSALEIDLEPVAAADVVSGTPQTGEVELGTIDEISVGVWTHTVGVSTAIEIEEFAVILSGHATLVINGTDTVTLSPGTLLQLHEGDSTVWTVTETLRKVYVARS